MQVKENGAATHERLDVIPERFRIEATDLRKELPFATRPLQKGA